jgi:long-chain acyl-CoA synthetase
MNLVTLADENLKSFGEYPFLIFEDVIFTNRQMINDTSGMANGLKKLGVNKGDKVVVMLPNCPEVLISYQGILRCGAVIVPIIPLMNERELSHILGNCEAVAMITTRDIFQKAEEILNYCQNQLAKYKWPKFIEFTKSLPRNPMGKILRKELRKLNNRDS